MILTSAAIIFSGLVNRSLPDTPNILWRMIHSEKIIINNTILIHKHRIRLLLWFHLLTFADCSDCASCTFKNTNLFAFFTYSTEQYTYLLFHKKRLSLSKILCPCFHKHNRFLLQFQSPCAIWQQIGAIWHNIFVFKWTKPVPYSCKRMTFPL